MADDDLSRLPSAEELAASVAERVRRILTAAEHDADELRLAAAAESEKRAREIRAAAERDAERLLRRAEREAQAYLDDAHRRVDAFAEGRARRISAVADLLVAHAETLAAQAERATRLRRGIDELVAALGEAAEAVAAEAGREPIVLPDARDRGAEVTRLSRPTAVPDAPAGAAERAPDDLGEHVRQIASALPRRPGAIGGIRPVPPVPPGGDGDGEDDEPGGDDAA